MRKYLYSEGKEPMIVEQCQEMDGWFDSPLNFVKTTDFGVDPENKEKVQLLGETITAMTECCNGLLNLNLMSMKDLRAFALKFYDVKAKSKKKLIHRIEVLSCQQPQTSSKVH